MLKIASRRFRPCPCTFGQAIVAPRVPGRNGGDLSRRLVFLATADGQALRFAVDDAGAEEKPAWMIADSHAGLDGAIGGPDAVALAVAIEGLTTQSAQQLEGAAFLAGRPARTLWFYDPEYDDLPLSHGAD